MSGRWKDAWRCPFVEKCWQLVQDGTNCLSAFVQNVSSMRESYLWLTWCSTGWNEIKSEMVPVIYVCACVWFKHHVKLLQTLAGNRHLLQRNIQKWKPESSKTISLNAAVSPSRCCRKAKHFLKLLKGLKWNRAQCTSS